MRTSFSRPTRRQFLQASAAAVSGLTLSSCGWTLANVRQTVETAPDRLYIYTWAGYTDRELIERFRAETGITVIADVFDSNEAMLAKMQAGGGGAYSVIYPSDYMVRKMRGLGLLAELDRSQLDGMDRLFPRFADPVYDPDNRYSVPMSWGTTGLVYDRTVLDPPPQDWDYLWQHKQRLAKRMTLLNDVREVMGAALKRLGYSYNTSDPDKIRAAYESLTQLKGAIAAFTSDAWRPQILTGDLTVAMCYSADANEVMREDPNLDYALPTSGSSLWTDTLVIPITAPNPAGAYAWINFMLRPDVAARICERLSFATPNREAYNLLPPEVKNNTSLFPSESALERCEGLIPLPKANAIYDRYWTKLSSG